jgi:hypothetical protein
MISTNSAVPEGAPVQVIGGETLSPSQVYFFGMNLLSGQAVVASKVPMVGTEVAETLGAALGDGDEAAVVHPETKTTASNVTAARPRVDRRVMGATSSISLPPGSPAFSRH